MSGLPNDRVRGDGTPQGRPLRADRSATLVSRGGTDTTVPCRTEKRRGFPVGATLVVARLRAPTTAFAGTGRHKGVPYGPDRSAGASHQGFAVHPVGWRRSIRFGRQFAEHGGLAFVGVRFRVVTVKSLGSRAACLRRVDGIEETLCGHGVKRP